MRSFFGALGSIRRSKPGQKACPKCGSHDVQPLTLLDGIILPTRFLCKHCGYSGYVVVETQVDGKNYAADDPLSNPRRRVG